MASADILRAARARIEDPKNWTTDVFARTAEGAPVGSRESNAVCWCAVGSLNVERLQAEWPLVFLNEAAWKLFSIRSASSVNDELGHAAVLKMYDAAIAAAEAEAGR